MKKMLLILSITVVLAGFVGAETLRLTVDEAVEMAVAENLSLKQSVITLQTKERAKDSAWNVFLPSMAASAGVNADHGVFPFGGNTPSGITDAGNFGVNAGLNLSLPLNLAAGAGISNLKADYEAGLLDYESAQKSLEMTVQQQFYHILANEENIKIQQANIDLAQKRYEQALSNFENGLSPELEVLSAEVTLAGLQPAYNGAVAGYNAMVLLFKTTIGADRNDELDLVGELPTELYELDADELINAYTARRLDIRSLDKQIEVLKYSKGTLARNFNTPTLNLGYTYGLSGSNADTTFLGAPIDPWSDWADRGSISLTLQWKFDGLIPGSSSDVQLKEMQDGIDSLILAREMAWQGAETEITTLVDSLKTNALTIVANTSGTELARRSYELTEEAYNVGTRELLDVESAQNDYLAAQQDLLVAKYNYVYDLLALENALNTPIEDFTKE